MALSPQRKPRNYLPWILGGAAVLVLGMVAVGALALFVLRGNVSATELTLQQQSIIAQEPVGITAKLLNKGLLGAKYHLNVLVDGQTALEQDIQVNGHEIQIVNLSLPAMDAGVHTISVAKLSCEARVLTPAAFEVVSLTAEPASCMAGENAVLHVTVRNTGETAGNYTPDAMMDSSSLTQPAPVPVAPGATADLQIPLTAPAAGSHVLELGALQTTLQVLRPANIDVSALTAAAPFVPLNQDAQLTATLRNDGDVDGSFDLTLLINGEAQQTQTITVPAQQTAEATLTVRFSQPGSYELKAGNAAPLQISAVEITRPGNGALLAKQANGGSGKLTLTNNYDQDALFLMASSDNPQQTLLAVYVHGNTTVKNVKVKDGEYIVYYSLGTDFDGASRRFLTNASYNRFTDNVTFKTTRSGGYVTYSVWTITLNSGNGNTSTNTVPQDQFPS